MSIAIVVLSFLSFLFLLVLAIYCMVILTEEKSTKMARTEALFGLLGTFILMATIILLLVK